MKQIPNAESFMIYKCFYTEAARNAIEETIEALRDEWGDQEIASVLLQGLEAELAYRRKDRRWFCSRCYCRDCAYNERRAPEAEYKLISSKEDALLNGGWEYIGKLKDDSLYMRRRKAERE